MFRQALLARTRIQPAHGAATVAWNFSTTWKPRRTDRPLEALVRVLARDEEVGGLVAHALVLAERGLDAVGAGGVGTFADEVGLVGFEA